MHFVLRGNEPARLKPIRYKYTRAWVDHYKNGIGEKPKDAKWRGFLPDLSTVFNGCCGYCEAYCKGVVDHFRPKSQFPELVYEWSNWIFACHDCNFNKLDKWPTSGFSDPCNDKTFCNLQYSFVYDLKTGEALPNPKLTPDKYICARDTIEILGLNELHHLKTRLYHIEFLKDLKKLSVHDPTTASQRFALLVLGDAPLCSLTRYYLEKEGLI